MHDGLNLRSSRDAMHAFIREITLATTYIAIRSFWSCSKTLVDYVAIYLIINYVKEAKSTLSPCMHTSCSLLASYAMQISLSGILSIKFVKFKLYLPKALACTLVSVYL